MTRPRRRFDHPATFAERCWWTACAAALAACLVAASIVMAGAAH